MDNSEELAQAFSTAVTVALREMAGLEASLADAGTFHGNVRSGEIETVVRLSGNRGGFLHLGMCAASATELAKRVLAGTVQVIDQAIVRDCFGEVGNIVAGQAKTLLFETTSHFSFSPPITDGSQQLPHAEWLVQSFVSDVGELTLHVHLPS